MLLFESINGGYTAVFKILKGYLKKKDVLAIFMFQRSKFLKNPLFIVFVI